MVGSLVWIVLPDQAHLMAGYTSNVPPVVASAVEYAALAVVPADEW